MDKKTKGGYINKNKYGISEYIAMIIAVIVGIVMFTIVFRSINSTNVTPDISGEYTVVDTYSTVSETDLEQQSSSDEHFSEEAGNNAVYETIIIDNTELYKGDLVLINNDNLYQFLDETPIIDVYSKKNGKYKLGTGNERLVEKVIDAANNFLGDFFDTTGLTNVTMVNGYFTEEEQRKRYENYIKSVDPDEAEKWGVKAGASDHHTALSFNLSLYPSNGKIGEGKYLWLTENAHDYGFILRYPIEKQEITKVKDDNHFRYVGIPHATYMYENQICLEEYLEVLYQTTYYSPLKMSTEDKEYFIYYFPCNSSADTTEIKIPQGFIYNYSGDNINGFIVTAYLEK